MRFLTTFTLLFVSYITVVNSYTLKDQDLTAYEFQRYVQPQLNSILQDYTVLIIALNEDFSSFKGEIKNFRNLISLASDIHTQCQDFKNTVCAEKIRILHNLQLLIYKSLESPMLYQQTKDISTTHIVDLQIETWKLREVLRAQILNNFFQIDRALLEFSLEEKISLSPVEILNSLEKSYILFNLLLLTNIKKDFKDSLHSFWLSFIRPAYKYVLIQNNQAYFQNNITEFNFRLNEINAYLTKRVAKVPKQAVTMIKIIHNRWNNILKVTLKPLQ